MSIVKQMKTISSVLVFCPYSKGGLADYARAQGKALAGLAEIQVLWLAPDDLPPPKFARRVGRLVPLNAKNPGNKLFKVARAIRFLRSCLHPMLALEKAILEEQPDAVLLVSYAEYLAPLWAWRFRRLRKRGLRFGAVVHDPIRDHQVGPAFWHRWSIAEAYSFLDVAFVHEPITLDTVRTMQALRTVVIPHGLYDFETKQWSRLDARRMLNLPDNAPVFLSFGHIRDGKNLDQFIEAMIGFPQIYLIVAGKEQSSSQKPGTFYQDLARRIGVDSRIRWNVRHIPESETGMLFAAADHLLLTYSADFRSASGVLAAAAQFNKPVIASGGDGPMKNAILNYRLGYFGLPSDQESLNHGIRQVLSETSSARWDSFRQDHSWNINAKRVSCKLLE
jgi:glycosyltransferase involved in cell wall biosynthesis